MLDDPMTITAAYVAGSAVLSTAMARFSPTIGPRFQHLFAGSAPMVALFASLLDGQESATLHGADLLAGAGLIAAGIVTSFAIDLYRIRSRRRALRG